MPNQEFRVFVTGHRPNRLCGGAAYEAWKRTPEGLTTRVVILAAVDSIRTLAETQIDDTDVVQQTVCAVGQELGVERLFLESVGVWSPEMRVPYELFVRSTENHVDSLSGEEIQETFNKTGIPYTIATEARRVHIVSKQGPDAGIQALHWVAQGENGVVAALWDGKQNGRTHKIIQKALDLGIEVWHFHQQNNFQPHRIPGWRDHELTISFAAHPQKH